MDTTSENQAQVAQVEQVAERPMKVRKVRVKKPVDTEVKKSKRKQRVANEAAKQHEKLHLVSDDQEHLTFFDLKPREFLQIDPSSSECEITIKTFPKKNKKTPTLMIQVSHPNPDRQGKRMSRIISVEDYKKVMQLFGKYIKDLTDQTEDDVVGESVPSVSSDVGESVPSVSPDVGDVSVA